jgi:hypothetical protein
VKINTSETVELAGGGGLGHMPTVSIELTLSLLAIAASAGSFAGWRGARPADLLRPRIVPWRFVMLLCFALVFFLLIHLAALVGLAPAR